MTDMLIEYISCSREGQFVEELQKYGQILPLKEIHDLHSPEGCILVATVKYVYEFVSDENGRLIKLILRAYHKSRQKKENFFGFVFNEFATELKNVSIRPGHCIALCSAYVENNTRSDFHTQIHDLQVLLGVHPKDRAKIFLMKKTEKPAVGEKAAATNNIPQSVTRDDRKEMYKYKKISEITTIGRNINLYAVIKELIRVPTYKVKHGIIAVIDETCNGDQDFLVHLFYKKNTRCPIFKVDDIIRFHRMKVESHNNKLDGRVFRSFDIVVFPLDGKGCEGARSSAQSYHFSQTDAARVAELRRWKEYMATAGAQLPEFVIDSSNLEVTATALKDIRMYGTYNIECKVLYKEMASHNVLLLTVADGTVQPNIGSNEVKITVTDPPVQFKQLKVSSLVVLENVKTEKNDPQSAHPTVCFKMSGPNCSCEILRGNDPRAIQIKRRIREMNEILTNSPINTAEEYLRANLTENIPKKSQEKTNCAGHQLLLKNTSLENSNTTPEELQQNMVISEPSTSNFISPKKNIQITYPLSPSGKSVVLKSKRDFKQLFNDIHKKVIETHCTPADSEQTSNLLQDRNKRPSQEDSGSLALKELLQYMINETPPLLEENQEPIASEQSKLDSPLRILPVIDERTETMEQSLGQNNFGTRSKVIDRKENQENSSQNNILQISDCIVSQPREICDNRPLESHEERYDTYESHPLQHHVHTGDTNNSVPLQSHEVVPRSVENQEQQPTECQDLLRAEYQYQRSTECRAQIKTECQEQREADSQDQVRPEYQEQTGLQQVERSVVELPPMSDFSDTPSDIEVQSCIRNFIKSSTDTYSEFSLALRSELLTSTQLSGSRASSQKNDTASDESEVVSSSCIDENVCSQRFSAIIKMDPEPGNSSGISLEFDSISADSSSNVSETSKFSPSGEVNKKLLFKTEGLDNFSDTNFTENISSTVEHSENLLTDNPVDPSSMSLDSQQNACAGAGTQISKTIETCFPQSAEIENNSKQLVETNTSHSSLDLLNSKKGAQEDNYVGKDLQKQTQRNQPSISENYTTSTNIQESRNNETPCQYEHNNFEDNGHDRTVLCTSISTIVESTEKVSQSVLPENLTGSNISTENAHNSRKEFDNKRDNLLDDLSMKENNPFHSDRRYVLPRNMSVEGGHVHTERTESDNRERDVSPLNMSVEERNAVHTERIESNNRVRDVLPQNMAVEERDTVHTETIESDNSERDVLRNKKSVEERHAVHTDGRESDNNESVDLSPNRSLEELEDVDINPIVGRHIEYECNERLLLHVFHGEIAQELGLGEYCFEHIKLHLGEACTVKGWVLDVEPPIYDTFPLNNIVSGVCECSEVCSFMGLEEYDPKTHTAICSACLQKGIRREMQLIFYLRLHLLNEYDNQLIVSISSYSAIDFLACTVREYLENERTYHRVNDRLADILVQNPDLPAELRGPRLKVIVTPTESSAGVVDYVVHHTYLFGRRN